MCVTVAVSSVGSSSSAAETVTVLAVAQFEVVKVRLAGFALTSALSVGSTMVTVTVAVGWVSSTTVYVFVPPSLTVSDVGVTVTPRVSLSVTSPSGWRYSPSRSSHRSDCASDSPCRPLHRGPGPPKP